MESLPDKISISDHVLFQQIGEECVLLNLESEQYFGLDDVGARIWQLLSENENPRITLVQLMEEYDIDESTLSTDLSNLLTLLEKEKLIVLE